MIAYAAKWENDLRVLHMFDSFEGLPHPHEKQFKEWMANDWGVSKEK
jgi:hypothetical protein